MRLTRIGPGSPEPEETLGVDGDNVVLGRSPARGLKIADSTISREHARLFLRDGQWNVADLNSSNGTFVNGERVTRATLKPGDVLKLGSVELRVEEDVAAASGAAPVSDAGAPGDITLEEAARLFDEPTVIQSPRPAASSGAPPTARTATRAISTAALRSASTTSPTAKKSGKVSVLRADLGQYGFLPRLLLVIIALALAYGAFVFVSRVTEDAVPNAAPAGTTPSENPQDTPDDGH